MIAVSNWARAGLGVSLLTCVLALWLGGAWVWSLYRRRHGPKDLP